MPDDEGSECRMLTGDKAGRDKLETRAPYIVCGDGAGRVARDELDEG